MEKWVKALRSGDYKQGTGKLIGSGEPYYCCLGVLCDISTLGSWDTESCFAYKTDGKNTLYDSLLPQTVINWAGLNSGNGNRTDDPANSLARLNDNGTSFAKIADIIEEQTQPEALAVVIKAQHFCMISRGVKEHESDMTTSIMRGLMLKDAPMRQEFLNLMNNMKGHNN